MYEGFKKVYSEDSKVFHISVGFEKTFCGQPITESLKIQESESELPPKDKRVCKKCRSSVISHLSNK